MSRNENRKDEYLTTCSSVSESSFVFPRILQFFQSMSGSPWFLMINPASNSTDSMSHLRFPERDLAEEQRTPMFGPLVTVHQSQLQLLLADALGRNAAFIRSDRLSEHQLHFLALREALPVNQKRLARLSRDGAGNGWGTRRNDQISISLNATRFSMSTRVTVDGMSVCVN